MEVEFILREPLKMLEEEKHIFFFSRDVYFIAIVCLLVSLVGFHTNILIQIHLCLT